LKIIIYWHKTQGLVLNFVTASCAEPHSPYNSPFDLHNINNHVISPYLPWSNKMTFLPTLILLKFRTQSVCLSSPNPRHTPRISQPLHFTVLSTNDQYKSHLCRYVLSVLALYSATATSHHRTFSQFQQLYTVSCEDCFLKQRPETRDALTFAK